MNSQSLLVVALSSIMLPTTVTGFPLSQFYPFGSAAGDNSLPANDDESTPSIPLGVRFPFFGSSYSSLYVNNNGDVTFDTALNEYNAKAFPITGSHKMIAPFWTDISTAQGGYLWYRTTTDSSILQLGTNKIRTVFPSFATFSATMIMIVTWEDVAAYGCSDTGAITCQQRNTFQLVLITNGVHSFAIFMYYVINWTKSTQAGINAGDGTNYYSVSGSMTDSLLNLPQMSNIGVPGQFVFRVENREITAPGNCASSPCVHGSCSNGHLQYVCTCDPGYTGVNCHIDINECSSSPCVHGTCSDRVNGYVCNCLSGYTGSHCHIDINECSSSPCVHGTCSERVNGYVCNCVSGYTGSHCNININECSSSPCVYGTCLDRVNGYVCNCVPGYTGSRCNIDINECSSSPCVHGTCSDRVNGYVCNCLLGYTGRLCEIDIDECQSSPCINGNCTNNINFYTCQCFAGFTGTNCEIDIDECEISPCVHGNCTDQVNGYVCECIAGYTGVICETEINECESSPCSHGVCLDEINAYQCVCDTGYYGRQCSYFDVLYLWPLLVGSLLLLVSIFLLFLWKRWKRHYSGEEESGLLAFNDVTLGPGKAAFQSSPHVNKTKISIPVKECVGFFLKINRSLTPSNFVKMVEKVKMSANRVLEILTSLRTNKVTIKDCEVNTIS